LAVTSFCDFGLEVVALVYEFFIGVVSLCFEARQDLDFLTGVESYGFEDDRLAVRLANAIEWDHFLPHTKLCKRVHRQEGW